MWFKLSSEAKKYLNTLDKTSANRIYDALRKLTQYPPMGDAKPLQGSGGLFRLRVGDIRIIYEAIGDNILVLKISPRGQAYKM